MKASLSVVEHSGATDSQVHMLDYYVHKRCNLCMTLEQSIMYQFVVNALVV